MNVLLNVYICASKKKSAVILPEGTVKYTHLAPLQIHRGRQLINKNGAIAKVNILVEQVIL